MIEALDRYFNKHLAKAFWASLDADTKESAFNMAKTDIAALLRDPAPIEDLSPGCEVFNAIAEQALFLIKNESTWSEGKVATGESLGGAMSESFTLVNSEHSNISPRAQLIVNQINRVAKLPGTLRLGRG